MTTYSKDTWSGLPFGEGPLNGWSLEIGIGEREITLRGALLRFIDRQTKGEDGGDLLKQIAPALIDFLEELCAQEPEADPDLGEEIVQPTPLQTEIVEKIAAGIEEGIAEGKALTHDQPEGPEFKWGDEEWASYLSVPKIDPSLVKHLYTDFCNATKSDNAQRTWQRTCACVLAVSLGVADNKTGEPLTWPVKGKRTSTLMAAVRKMVDEANTPAPVVKPVAELTNLDW